MTLLSLLLLYIAFRVKQFVCDFALQAPFVWMALGKGKSGQEYIKPLFAHSGIHALGTLLIVLFFVPALWYLAIIDFVVHSLVDRIKAVLTVKSGWKFEDSMFWVSFGLDQEAHNFTHLAYIIVIILYLGGISA